MRATLRVGRNGLVGKRVASPITATILLISAKQAVSIIGPALYCCRASASRGAGFQGAAHQRLLTRQRRALPDESRAIKRPAQAA